ncbi:MAG: hypothetical protein ACI9BW_002982 [Gammaproteobacteria bacterium]|jgi:hypothetical protein
MLNDLDAEFHSFRPDQRDWAETNYFGFYNAEAHLNVGVYALFRPNLGMVSSSICMNSQRASTPWAADFCDYRAALPMPANNSLLDYELANSLHVRCVDPNRQWHITYDDEQGTSIDVQYSALMVPFDINDPEQDPMCASGTDAGKFSWGNAYDGHFDQTGRVVGEVVLRGVRFPIDCVSTMDHSWGPRPERGKPNMSWLHAHVDDQTALHAILSFDADSDDTSLSLAHGYALQNGEVFGLASGTGRVVRGPDRFARTIDLELLDSAGHAHKLTGQALTNFPWQCWPNMVAFNVLARWQYGGREAYGEVQDFYELPKLNRLNAGKDAPRVDEQ